MKKLLTLLLLGGVTLFFIQSCKKTESQITQESPSFSTAPLTGLVVIAPLSAMTSMLSDADPVIQSENENMDIAAQAFQLIACDIGFEDAIGNAVNSDLEFDVEVFLANNPGYSQTILTWMTANNHSMTGVFGDGVNNGMWACLQLRSTRRRHTCACFKY